MATIAQRAAKEEEKALYYVKVHRFDSPPCIIYDRYPNGTIRIRFIYKFLIFFKKTLEVTAYHEKAKKEDVAIINGGKGRGSSELFDFLYHLGFTNAGLGYRNEGGIGTDWALNVPAEILEKIGKEKSR